MRSDERSRREAAGSGAKALAVLAAASLPALARVARALAESSDDRALIESALAAQQTAAVAYRSAADSGSLAEPQAGLVMLLGDQAEAHAATLASRLRALGGERPASPRPDEIEGLSALRGEADFAAFAIELENAAVRRCVKALQELQAPALLEPIARIMASSGQHLVLLRQALSPDPDDWVPDAFETGTSPAPA